MTVTLANSEKSDSRRSSKADDLLDVLEDKQLIIATKDPGDSDQKKMSPSMNKKLFLLGLPQHQHLHHRVTDALYQGQAEGGDVYGLYGCVHGGGLQSSDLLPSSAASTRLYTVVLNKMRFVLH